MKIAIMLSMLVFVSCAAHVKTQNPVPTPTPLVTTVPDTPAVAPTSQPTCFMEPGMYLLVRELRKTTCQDKAPLDNFAAPTFVAEKSVKCGMNETNQINAQLKANVRIVMAFATNGGRGIMTVHFQDCYAIYEILLLKLQHKKSGG